MLSEPLFQQTKRHTSCPHILLQQAESFMLVAAAIVLLDFSQTHFEPKPWHQQVLFSAFNIKTLDSNTQKESKHRSIPNLEILFRNLFRLTE